ncbi:MAG: glycosyltransferase family 4 protein [Candidatus Cloacimonetes bacterium]|nr:glycosyltransferase family 4 protein [Candidatus Cloacimonadota bacterium]
MKEKALLVLPTCSSFMDVDQKILGELFDLTTVFLGQDLSKQTYLQKILTTLFSLRSKRKFSRVFIWFADYHAAPICLLAKALGITTHTFIGGYDAVKYPELNMGVYCSFWRGLCARIALKHSDLIIANHKALLSSSNTYYNPSGHPEGIYRLVPALGSPAAVVFNAVEPAAPPDLNKPRKAQILTVGTTPRLQDFQNKGFDLLSQIAKRRPDLSFIFVGIQKRWQAALEQESGLYSLPNLQIHEFLPRAELMELMAESAVYAQPSISEGMPNALMEAMLMGCFPVGSDVAGIPTVIGNHGIIIPRRDSRLLEKALDEALAQHPDRQAISESISTRFSLQNRKEALRKLLFPTESSSSTRA